MYEDHPNGQAANNPYIKIDLTFFHWQCACCNAKSPLDPENPNVVSMLPERFKSTKPGWVSALAIIPCMNPRADCKNSIGMLFRPIPEDHVSLGETAQSSDAVWTLDSLLHQVHSANELPLFTRSPYWWITKKWSEKAFTVQENWPNASSPISIANKTNAPAPDLELKRSNKKAKFARGN